MKDQIEKPSINLETLFIVIQILQTEINDYETSLDKKELNPEDYLWLSDLHEAALDLKEAYTSFIEKHKIINYPSYQKLIKP